MSTENMRKLMQLTEGLDDNRNDDYCPTCHGWGEILPPDVEQDMDNIVPCPDCGPGDEYAPRLKTKDIKDLAFAMDESEDDSVPCPVCSKDAHSIGDGWQCGNCGEKFRWVGNPFDGMLEAEGDEWEVEDFPVSESKGGNVKQVIRAVERVAEHYREESDYYDDEFSDSDDAEYFNLIVKLIKSKQPERAAYKLDNLDSIVQETMQSLLSDEEQIALHKFVTSYGHNGFDHWDDVYYGLQEARYDPQEEVSGVCRWWRDCENKATTTEPHPILGEVPICDRCVAKLRKIEGLDEDDGDVPSRRVDDAELTHALLTKVDSALNELAKGMEAEMSVGNFDAKQRAIQLRRELKEIKAHLESGEKLVSMFNKVQVANATVNALTDLSYEFDDVQMDVQDAENLLYLHLNKRPVAIDESDDKGKPYICVHVKKGKHECYADSSYGAAKKAAEHWGLKSTAGIDAHLAIDEAGCPCGKDGCGCGPDCDCEPVKESSDNLDWGVGDYVVPAWESGEWEVPLEVIGVRDDQVLVQDDFGNKELMFPEDLRKAPEAPELFPGTMDALGKLKIGEEGPLEDISLGSIVESILGERGQPVDYELSDEELADKVEDETAEFERDKIDPEIEDEELGLRFD